MRQPENILRRLRSSGGFTLVETMVAVSVFAVVAGSVILVLNNSSRAKQDGDNLTEAQQNARTAINAIVTDLRQAGYGVGSETSVPIEVASEYRMTLVVDNDRDGIIEPGERRTYFLDPDMNQDLASRSRNPYDTVLRRVISTVADSMATPAAGAGTAVAYLLTQRNPNGSAAKEISLFSYLDDSDVNLLGAGTDPAGSDYGKTVPDSLLKAPNGGAFVTQVSRVEVRVVTESASPKSGTNNEYRRVELGSTISPRNLGFNTLSSFVVNYDGGGGSPGDSTGDGGGDGGTDSTDTDPVLPPYEPPIRISTERVLSLGVGDLSETDSMEGSDTGDDYQQDVDLVLGTKAGGAANLYVWFNGQPGRYGGTWLFNSVANYYGNSTYDLNAVEIVNVDSSPTQYRDVVGAIRVSDTTGGFQVWLNQYWTYPGWVGNGYPTTSSTAYYSNSSGQGTSLAVADFDGDGDQDVVLGTITNSTSGEIEYWRNDGMGVFTFVHSADATGAVLSLAVVDFDRDGLLDVVAGTRTSNSDKAGKVDVYRNGVSTFSRFTSYISGGKVNALAAADINEDGILDIVAGTKTGTNSGKVEFWKGTGTGFTLADQAAADGPVLSVAVGPINFPAWHNDVVAGTSSRTIQAWFVDPDNGDDVLPLYESWADANVGGEVNAVRIAKLERGAPEFGSDLLYDIVAGSAIGATTGEIVIYLNPYVWTLNP